MSLYEVKCKDVGFKCPFIAKASSKETVINAIKKHVKEEHGVSNEVLRNPKFLNIIKTSVEKI